MRSSRKGTISPQVRLFDRELVAFRSKRVHQWFSGDLTGEKFSAHNHWWKTRDTVVFITGTEWNSHLTIPSSFGRRSKTKSDLSGFYSFASVSPLVLHYMDLWVEKKSTFNVGMTILSLYCLYHKPYRTKVTRLKETQPGRRLRRPGCVEPLLTALG